MNYKYESNMYVKIIDGKWAGYSGKIICPATVYDEETYTVRLTNCEYDCECDIPAVSLDRTFMEKFILDIPMNDSINNCDCVTISGGFESIKLAVYDKEGTGYPHFHFYHGLKPEGGIPGSKKSGGGCICFKEAAYFTHSNHKDTMDNSEIKSLIKFLNSIYKKEFGITVWQYMITVWNDQNPNCTQLPLDLSIPKYYASMPTVQAKNK